MVEISIFPANNKKLFALSAVKSQGIFSGKSEDKNQNITFYFYFTVKCEEKEEKI